MRRTTIAIAGLAGALALGALAGVTLAGGDQRGELVIDSARDFPQLDVVQTDPVQAARRAGSGQRPRRGQKLTFFQAVEPIPIEPLTEQGASLECDPHYRVVGGWFETGRSGTFLTLSAPALPEDPAARPTERIWRLAVQNQTDQPDQVQFGIVCLTKVK